MLSIDNASKTFQAGTPNEHKALLHFSLHLHKGEFVTLIGTNGAGKSTLFNAICGEFILDEGNIVLGGEDLTFWPEHRRALRIGRVFQNPARGTAPGLTVAENLAIAYARSYRHALQKAVTKKEMELFRTRLESFGMGLEERMHTKIGLLSGGQRQAVSLLMSTVAKPKLLLLDEHTAALDPAAAEKVLEITKRIVKEQNLTAMMITHSVKQALETGTRTIMMTGGQLAMDLHGEEREKMTVPRLLEKYSEWEKTPLDTDRVLFANGTGPD